MAGDRNRRAGRPRLRPAGNAGMSPRAEILDAAAGLFASQGLAATTTRQIADRVGIRQASLYYYFAGKDDILIELLTQSVRPSLELAKLIESEPGGHGPAAGLYALALADVQTLTRAPHNIGTLYLLPEVQSARYASFRAERAGLQAAYGRLGHAAAEVPGPDPVLTAALLMQLVETVIHLRRGGTMPAAGDMDSSCGHEIAGACLRLVGLGPGQIAQARDGAGPLLARLARQREPAIRR